MCWFFCLFLMQKEIHLSTMLTCFFPYLTCWRGGSTPAVTACVRICVVRAVWSCNGVWDFLPPFLKKHLEGPWLIPVPHVCITDGNEEVGSFSWCFCAVIWDFLNEHFLFLNAKQTFCSFLDSEMFSVLDAVWVSSLCLNCLVCSGARGSFECELISTWLIWKSKVNKW